MGPGGIKSTELIHDIVNARVEDPRWKTVFELGEQLDITPAKIVASTFRHLGPNCKLPDYVPLKLASVITVMDRQVPKSGDLPNRRYYAEGVLHYQFERDQRTATNILDLAQQNLSLKSLPEAQAIFDRVQETITLFKDMYPEYFPQQEDSK